MEIQEVHTRALSSNGFASKDPFTLFRDAALTFSKRPAIFQRHRPGSPKVIDPSCTGLCNLHQGRVHFCSNVEGLPYNQVLPLKFAWHAIVLCS
jgi:hypothetical protein